jgi:hypothetical protein
MHWNAIISIVDNTSSPTDQALQRNMVRLRNPGNIFVFRVLLYQLATSLALLKFMGLGWSLLLIRYLYLIGIFDWYEHKHLKTHVNMEFAFVLKI